MTGAALLGWVLPFVFLLGPLLLWLVFRRGGYKRKPDPRPTGPDWTRTGERFVDPASGELLDVWFNAATGERAYVRADRA